MPFPRPHQTKSKREAFRVANNRRAERFARYGRVNEDYVLSILLKAKQNDVPIFTEVYRHPPHSTEDGDGKDFTVGMMTSQGLVRRSFGVTISPQSQRMSSLKHPDTPQFHFPIGANPETVIKRVKSLFKNET